MTQLNEDSLLLFWLALGLYLLSFYLPVFKNIQTGQTYPGLLIFIPSFTLVSFRLTTQAIVAWSANIFFGFTFFMPYALWWAILSVVSSLFTFKIREIYQSYQYQDIKPSIGLFVWLSSFICILLYQILKNI